MAVRQVTGGEWQDAEGNPLALGTVVCEVSGDAQLSSSAGELCAGLKVRLTLDSSGSVPASPAQNLWPTDQMNPSNITYTVWVYSANGQLSWGPVYGLTVPSGAGAFDLDLWVPNQIGSGSGASAGSLTLQTNGVNNVSQQLLNLESTDNSVTITDIGNGSVNLQAAGGAPAASVPFITPPCALSQTGIVTGVLGALTINLSFVNLPYEITFSKLGWWSSTGDDGISLSDIGIYKVTSPTATVGTLVAHIGPTTGIVNNSVNDVAIVGGTVTLPAGLYLFATTNNTGAGFSLTYGLPAELGFAWSTVTISSGGNLPPTIVISPLGLVWLASGGIPHFTGGFPAIALS